ncbi:G patch domain-containing protein 1 homolog [Papilio machaon]|uniref:G patch domain-containing protein 1 homolog n=1 Tax=Papilio machaon TaxID=76193 RepID=UPI001E662D3C|nr:G patch domain-containing protein 1 homolog [Papilio machaon]
MSDSDTDEENVIRYGTPLEPYEEDEVPAKRKFQEPADQYAVDAHGRRRFHGAFTGGFSAGYGNTVGTPEGWAPATFKSSRSDKATISSQRPEDFMDDEDRDEFGIAPRQLETHREFSGQKRQRRQFFDGPIPGEPVLEQLVRAVHDTAAVRMLRAMGWREGQGTGERLAKAEKKRAKEQHKVYGCYVPPEMRNENPHQEDEDSSDSEIDYDTLFAPDDYEPYILQRKNDRFGLGYSGLSRHSVLGNLVGEYGDAGTSKSHLTMKEKGKKVSIRGQAFGVGAFEADDDDIYATEDMSHYDFTLGGPAKDKPKKVNAKTNNVLDGFVKSSVPLPSVPSYPPPALPRDYTPAPAGSRRSRFEPIKETPRDQGLGRHELTAEARGALLGETPVPKTTIVPETIPVQSDPIAKIVGRNVNFVSNTEKKTELDFIPIKDSGKEIQKVFKPFVGDPLKQARYERYLKNKDAMVESDSNIDRLCEWERDRELAEFEQAAKLYKPLTGIMEERFTHAAEPDDAVNPLCAVAKSTNNYGLATPEQIEAARIGAFGTMTRKETSWRPESLVCKRFNVPEPGTTRDEPKKDDKPKVSYSIFSYLESSVHDKESFTKEQTKFSGSKSLSIDTVTKSKQAITEKKKDSIEETTSQTSVNTGFSKRMTVAELFLKESEKDLKNNEQNVVTETINKFDKMDLYKSIFLSDSENEDETLKETNTKDINDFIEKPKNVERNTSPPRGIFANIDFDELNSWKRNADDKITETKTVNVTTPTNKTIDNDKCKEHTPETNEDGNVYGPKIPDNLKKRLEDNNTIVNDFKPIYRNKEERNIDSSSESDSWVEAKELKSKKDKKKKSKKHKSKHKKSKHKKKDR